MTMLALARKALLFGITTAFKFYPISMGVSAFAVSWAIFAAFTFSLFIGLSIAVISGFIINEILNKKFRARPLDAADTVLLTGGTHGIGRALIENFARDGFNIILTARDEQELQETKLSLTSKYHNIKVHVIQHDLYEEGAGRQLFDIVDKLDKSQFHVRYLVNNAGTCLRGNFLDLSLEEQRKMLQLDLLNLVDLCYLFGNRFRDEIRASPNASSIYRIMNVASFASVVICPFLAVYTGAKSFVHTFSLTLHDEVYAQTNGRMTVTSLCPGYTLTEGIDKMNLQHTVAKKLGQFDPASRVGVTGYRYMMTGKRWVIVGWSNYIISWLAAVLPVQFTSKLVRLFNADVASVPGVIKGEPLKSSLSHIPTPGKPAGVSAS